MCDLKKMLPRVIIISPDGELASGLMEALTHESVGADPQVVSTYPTAGELKKLVRSNSREVTAFVVGLADVGEGLKLVRELNASYPGSLAIAADSQSAADTILAAMRAGASEFLVPPFDLSHLQHVLQSHKNTGTASPSQSLGKLLCVLPAQGGSGASMIAVHSTQLISKAVGHKVLVVDFDFHSGTIAFRLRLKPEFSFADAVARIEDIDELWARLTCNRDSVDVLAAPPSGHCDTLPSFSPRLCDLHVGDSGVPVRFGRSAHSPTRLLPRRPELVGFGLPDRNPRGRCASLGAPPGERTDGPGVEPEKHPPRPQP